jgi:hypothetical protein
MQASAVQYRSLCGALHIAAVMLICVQNASSYNPAPVAVWCFAYCKSHANMCTKGRLLQFNTGRCVVHIAHCRSHANMCTKSRWGVVCLCIHWVVQDTRQHPFLFHAGDIYTTCVLFLCSLSAFCAQASVIICNLYHVCTSHALIM